jgi:hypothetical protein
MILDLIFILHAVATLPFAIWLIADPQGLAQLLALPTLTPGGEIFARLYAGCLVLIAHTTFLASLSFSYYARHLVLWVMLIQQILGIFLCVVYFAGYATVFYFALALFVVFAIAYLFILVLRPGDI